MSRKEWEEYFSTRSAISGDCIVWQLYIDKLGYGRAKKVQEEVKAHRVSWTLFYGPIPRGRYVLHRCDVRHCIKPEHLFLGNQADNVADMIAKGRAKLPIPQKGTTNPNAVLNEDDVWAIRWGMLKHKFFNQNEIARSYHVSPMTISRIANNHTWSHVTEQWPFDEVQK